MARVWSEERKLELWLEVELAALDAWVELGVVPADAARRARADATPHQPKRQRQASGQQHGDRERPGGGAEHMTQNGTDDRRRSLGDEAEQ